MVLLLLLLASHESMDEKRSLEFSSSTSITNPKKINFYFVHALYLRIKSLDTGDHIDITFLVMLCGSIWEYVVYLGVSILRWTDMI